MNTKLNRYKDDLPENTVKRIKHILEENNISVNEEWQEPSSVGTYALRLTIKNSDFGQNGKGMTKEFAEASAYAELLERYQNGTMIYRIEKPTEALPFSIAPDEKYMNVEDFVNENNPFLNNILKQNSNELTSKNNKIELLKEIFNENSSLISSTNKHLSLPYYNFKDDKIYHIPYLLYGYLCGSNGLCAGNTPEEALIEGISEILERYVSVKFFYDKTAFPEIPNEYLDKFPTIQNMLNKLKNNKNYSCKLVDCSLGGKYPVAGLFIIEKNTGRFGFKLGSHPDFGIAMERCFTEASQGIDILDYAKSCMFDFDDSEVTNNANIAEFIDTYVATLPYQIWEENPSYKFTEMPDVSNLSNKDILNKLLTNLINEGYDILIRNNSVLGFPTYSIIIPGMSEMTQGKMAGRFNMHETLSYILKHIDIVNLDNIDKIINMLEILKNEIGIQNLSTYAVVKDISVYPCETFGMGLNFMLSICYIMNKQYNKATEILENIVFLGANLSSNEVELSIIKAIYYYTSGMQKLNNHNKTMHYIKTFFDNNISTFIDNAFKNRENALKRIYNLSEDMFVDNDDTYYLPFMDTLRQKQKLNRINQLDNKLW